MKYLDLEVAIERTANGYEVHTTSSVAGESRSPFVLPFSYLEVENFILKMGQTRRGQRRADSPMTQAAKEFGGKLFQATFHDATYFSLRKAQQEAARQAAGLRIRLELDGAPDLAVLPWEYLYNPGNNQFIVLSNETPLVRQLTVQDDMPPSPVTLPIRILVVMASPSDYPALDVEREWQQLTENLDDLVKTGKVVLERLVPPSLPALQRALRRRDYHVFHFIGHGGFDPGTEEGVLLLVDEAGLSHAVTGEQFGVNLHDCRTLRLALLNACEGARGAKDDPFAGVAQGILQQGIPAVVAMQFSISDKAALTLAHEFYAAMTDGFPADAALADARKMIYNHGLGTEWGTPVLYLSGQDTQLFSFPPGLDADATSVPVEVSASGVLPAAAAAAMPMAPVVEPGSTELGPAAAPPPRPAVEEVTTRSPAPARLGEQAALIAPTVRPGLPRTLLIAAGALVVVVVLALAVRFALTPAPPATTIAGAPRDAERGGLVAVAPTATPTATWTPTPDDTATFTPRPTASYTLSPTPSMTASRTPTQPPTFTPTATNRPPVQPVQTLRVIPPPTERVLARPTPTPIPPPTPCQWATERSFEAMSARLGLGCPTGILASRFTAYQHFQRGHMLWMEGTNSIWVLYDGGAAGEYPDDWREGMSAFTCPAGENSSPQVKRGFGSLWCRNATIRNALGPATSGEEGQQNALQDFVGGRITHISGWSNAIIGVSNKGVWAKQ